MKQVVARHACPNVTTIIWIAGAKRMVAAVLALVREETACFSVLLLLLRIQAVAAGVSARPGVYPTTFKGM